MELLFNKKDFDKFRNWVDLNIEDLTWQGKFKEDFEEFWNIFFVDGLCQTEDGCLEASLPHFFWQGS